MKCPSCRHDMNYDELIYCEVCGEAFACIDCYEDKEICPDCEKKADPCSRCFHVEGCTLNHEGCK